MEGFLGLTLPNFIGQLINFLILLGLLTFFGYKPIRKMLDEYEHARAEVGKQISKARGEGQSIIGQAAQAGDRIKEEARQEARKEAQVIVERARAELARERDKIVDDLRKEFVDTAILAAEKVLSETLDKGKHHRLIEKALEESAALRRN